MGSQTNQIATEAEAATIGGAGTAIANLCVVKSKAAYFNCGVNGTYADNQAVKYSDLYRKSGGGGGGGGSTFEYTNGLFYGDFSAVNDFHSSALTDYVPVIFPYYNETTEFTTLIDSYLRSDGTDTSIENFLTDFGLSLDEYSHFIFPKFDIVPWIQGFYLNESGSASFWNGGHTANLRELCLTGCQLDPTSYVLWCPSYVYDYFISAPASLQLFSMGAGFSYVMEIEFENFRYAVTGNNETDPQYYSWFNCFNSTYAVYVLDFQSDVHPDYSMLFQSVVFYDNALHVYYDGVWRKNAFNPEVPTNAIVSSGNVFPTGLFTYNDTDVAFNVNQSIPVSAFSATTPQYSDFYVPYIFEMFNQIINRFNPAVVTALNQGFSIQLANSYTAPGVENKVVAYTLCVFQSTQATIADIMKNTTEYTLLGSMTVFDQSQNAIQFDYSSSTYNLYFTLEPDSDGLSQYLACYSSEWENALSVLIPDLDPNTSDSTMAYSLYIQITDGNWTYNAPDFSTVNSNFRIDFGPGFKSSIFYTTWQHPYNELRFG